MRCFASVLMMLSYQTDFFTVAYQKDLTENYEKQHALFINFTKAVPIESSGKTVNIGALILRKHAASSVILKESSNSGTTRYMVIAKFSDLLLLAFCLSQRPDTAHYDCSAAIQNFKYKVTFVKKRGKYEVLGGHGMLEDIDFKVSAYVTPGTRGVKRTDFAKAVDAQLVPFVEPTPLLAAIEGAINKSFRDTVLPKI